MELMKEELDAFIAGEAPAIVEKGFKPRIFANDMSNPVLSGILNLFYSGVQSGTLGLMVAKNKNTGDETPVLVGIVENGGPDDGVYIVASVLGKEGSMDFLAPDGKGGYIGDTVDE
jgi:hypothetical protein